MLFADVVRQPAARIGLLHQPHRQLERLFGERMLTLEFLVERWIGIRERFRRRAVHLLNPLRALRLLLGRERFFSALLSAAFEFLLEDLFVVGVRALAGESRVDPIREPVAVVLHLLRFGFALRLTFIPRLVLILRAAVVPHHRLAEVLHKATHRCRVFPALDFLFR